VAISPFGGDTAAPPADPAASLSPNQASKMATLAEEEARCSKCGAGLDRTSYHQLRMTGFCTGGHPLDVTPFFNEVLRRVHLPRGRPRR
jgi:hypothetical protein